jgi:hypothetical protein
MISMKHKTIHIKKNQWNISALATLHKETQNNSYKKKKNPTSSSFSSQGSAEQQFPSKTNGKISSLPLLAPPQEETHKNSHQKPNGGENLCLPALRKRKHTTIHIKKTEPMENLFLAAALRAATRKHTTIHIKKKKQKPNRKIISSLLLFARCPDETTQGFTGRKAMERSLPLAAALCARRRGNAARFA